MTEYDLVECDEYELFISSVNERLDLGWRCQGGVCVCQHDTNDRDEPSTWYAQAMVRATDNKPAVKSVADAHGGVTYRVSKEAATEEGETYKCRNCGATAWMPSRELTRDPLCSCGGTLQRGD